VTSLAQSQPSSQTQGYMQLTLSRGTNSPSYTNAFVQYSTNIADTNSWQTITNFPFLSTDSSTNVFLPMTNSAGFFKGFASK